MAEKQVLTKNSPASMQAERIKTQQARNKARYSGVWGLKQKNAERSVKR